MNLPAMAKSKSKLLSVLSMTGHMLCRKQVYQTFNFQDNMEQEYVMTHLSGVEIDE